MAKRTKKMTQKEEALYDIIANDVEETKANTDVWRNDHDKWYRLRFRIKKAKSFPFVGCSNLRLPTIETYIRKAKAALIGIYANIKPRMQVVPQSGEAVKSAGNVEKFLDYLADYHIMLMNKLVLCCDKMLEKGFTLMKVTWRMESRAYEEVIDAGELAPEEVDVLLNLAVPMEQILPMAIKKLDVDTSETVVEDNIVALEKGIGELRAGKTKVTVKLEDELYNAPDVYVCDPGSIYVPSDAGHDVQDLRWICEEYYESIGQLKDKARNGILDEDAVQTITDSKNGKPSDSTDKDEDKTIEATKDEREGIDKAGNQSEQIKIWEMYKYYSPKEGEPEQKWQFILAPDFRLILKKQVCPYDHKKYPFIRFATEIIDNRWFAPRGIPQHLEDVSKEIDAQHNQKIDNQTIRNAPMFKFRSGIVNPKLVRFIPGQGIPVYGMNPLDDSIKLMDNSNANTEFSYEREEMILKTTIQEYLGQVDYSLQSMINKRQPRTASEVGMQAQAANQVFSLDASMWTGAVADLFMQILQLCQQYMPERVYATVVGQDDLEPIQLSRDDIQGKYHIVCRGNDMNTNPMVRAQKSALRVQTLVNPLMLETGVITPPNVYNILKRYMQDEGEVGWKEMITQPKPPEPPQPPPPGTIITPGYDELTDAEQAQVLTSIGVKPDAQGRLLEKQDEREDEQHEQAMGIADKIIKMRGMKNAEKAKKEGTKKG